MLIGPQVGLHAHGLDGRTIASRPYRAATVASAGSIWLNPSRVSFPCEQSNRTPRPGPGTVAPDQVVRDAELFAQFAHLDLVEIRERLDDAAVFDHPLDHGHALWCVLIVSALLVPPVSIVSG